MTPIDQAARYVAKCPPAISGDGGHNKSYNVVCTIVHGFALDESQAYSVLQSWNATCQPPWKEHELRHKIRDALKANHNKPRGHKLSSHHCTALHTTPRHCTTQHSTTQHKPIIKPVEYDLKEDDLPEPIEDGCRALIDALFRDGEGIRIAQARLEDDGHEVPNGGGVCLSKEEWLKKLEKHNGNPNGIFSSSDKTGIYIAINPYKVGCTKDADVTEFRHALVEFDEQLSQGEQLNLYQQMGLPCAAIIDSGGKSVHAWVKIDARDVAEYNERVEILYAHFHAAGLKLDIKNKNPGRFSRLPNCIRFDRRQELLALNVGKESWSEWLSEASEEAIGECDTFESLNDLETDNDPSCVIGFTPEGKTTRYLCRGKAAFILAPSGLGKSTLAIDLAIAWALGKPAYGISPGKPRRSLIIQAENDRYDLAEMVQGIKRAHELDRFDPERWQQVTENVKFKTETRITGQAFVDRLRKLIEREKADIVWVDPMLSFMGIDVSRQQDVSHFLRAMLNPVLEDTGAVMFGIHHTGKPPPAKVTANWTALDYAYAGLGSSELVNWARAVLFLRPHSETQFELKLAKRGRRAGATHLNGEWTTSIWLQHASEGIRWEQIEEPSEGKADDGEDKPKAEKLTKPEKVNRAVDLSFFDAIPTEGEGLRQLIKRLSHWMTSPKAKPKMVVSKGTGERAVELMLASEKLKCSDGIYTKGPNA